MIEAILLVVAAQEFQAKPSDRRRDPFAGASVSVPIASSARVVGNPGTWVTVDDYPADALAARQQGSVRVSYNVNAQGLIENCQVASSSGWPSLDAATCRLITLRGRYTPAQDATGQAIPGGKRTLRFNWAITPR
jgi:periplasmic protein TonB